MWGGLCGSKVSPLRAGCEREISHGRNLRNTLLLVPGRVLGGFVVAVITLIIASLVTMQTLSNRTSSAKSVRRTFSVLEPPKSYWTKSTIPSWR